MVDPRNNVQVNLENNGINTIHGSMYRLHASAWYIKIILQACEAYMDSEGQVWLHGFQRMGATGLGWPKWATINEMTLLIPAWSNELMEIQRKSGEDNG